MKSKDVLRILRIARPTLSRYVKEGTIKVKLLPNGKYDYDEESVYSFINKNFERETCIYARVSTAKQKNDLENQVEQLKQFCLAKGYTVNSVYQDIASGIVFDKRKQFFELLDKVLDGKVRRVVITYKDRLSRVAFSLLKVLFEKYNCEIVVISEVGSDKLDSEEIFEEMVSMLHCYSMKLYSKRRVKKIKEVFEDKLPKDILNYAEESEVINHEANREA